jgi:hypothetical protein
MMQLRASTLCTAVALFALSACAADRVRGQDYGPSIGHRFDINGNQTAFSETAMRELYQRLPGMTILSAQEFREEIVGRTFDYRELGSNLTIERPNEAFRDDGTYERHALRVVLFGTYEARDNAVSIVCDDCPANFLGLSNDRAFLRYEGKLFVTGANGNESIFELIPQS